MIILSALMVFLSAIPGQGVLTLDKGAIRYDGSLVRGKMNGREPSPLKMGIPIQVTSSTALLVAMVSLSPRMAGPMKGSLLMASRRAKAP